jgi:CheY-like chemotaxis protein
MRAQPWGAGLLLIAVTGWGQDHDRQRTASAGFDHHLVKPVDPDELLALLAAHAGADRISPPLTGQPELWPQQMPPQK